jgi:hypothetical protein
LEGVITLFRRVEVILRYVGIENVDIAREDTSIWYLAQQVTIVAGGKIGYRTREQEVVLFVKGQTDRRTDN